MEETQPLERKRTVSLDKLFELVTFGSRDPEVLSSIASRLTRLDRQLTPIDRTALTDVANGQPLASIAGQIVAALDPDRQLDAARALGGDPTDEQLAQATRQLLQDAARPLAANPSLRNLILGVKKKLRADDRYCESGPAT